MVYARTTQKGAIHVWGAMAGRIGISLCGRVLIPERVELPPQPQHTRRLMLCRDCWGKVLQADPEWKP